MVISFDKLPFHLTLECFHKVEFNDYINLQKSSKFTLKFSENVKKTLYYDIDKLSVQAGTFPIDKEIGNHPVIVNIKVLDLWTLTDKVYLCLKKTFPPNWKCERISALGIPCNPQWFNRLIVISKAKSFYVHKLDNFHLYEEGFKKLKGRVGFHSPIDDGELLLLQCSSCDLHSSGITSFGAQKFLKQWMTGKREIVEPSLIRRFSPFELTLIVKDIPHEILWNDEIKKRSVFHSKHYRAPHWIVGVKRGNQRMVLKSIAGELWLVPVSSFTQYLDQLFGGLITIM